MCQSLWRHGRKLLLKFWPLGMLWGLSYDNFWVSCWPSYFWYLIFWGIWRYIKVYEDIWTYFKEYRCILTYIRVYEGIWRCTEYIEKIQPLPFTPPTYTVLIVDVLTNASKGSACVANQTLSTFLKGWSYLIRLSMMDVILVAHVATPHNHSNGAVHRLSNSSE